MKTFSKHYLLGLLATTLVLALPSCGSEDPMEEKFFAGDCKQTISLESGPANSSITTATISYTLDDMLKSSTGYGTPISLGEFLFTGSNTAVKVTGLPAGTALKDFKINLNGVEKNFGEVSNERVNLNLFTDQNLDFFKQAFNRMMADKKLITKVSFTPTERTSEQVKLQIVFSGRFSYWEKI